MGDIFQVYLHPEPYTSKQAVSADVGKINNRITQFSQVITLPNLAKELGQGKSVLLAMMKDGKRKKENFESMRIFMVDIDNTDGKNRLTDGYLPLESALLMPFVQQYSAFCYKSLSYQEDWHKYRLVFVLDQEVTNNAEVERVYQYLLNQFGACADQSIKTSDRLFFGGFDATEINFDNRIKLVDIPKQEGFKWDNVPELQQVSSVHVDDDLDELVKAYIEKDQDNLSDEDKWKNVLYSLVKDVQDGVLTKDKAEQYIQWIALGDADWEKDNLKRLRDEIQRGTQARTNWGFIDKVRYVVGERKQHPIKQILDTLKQYSYQDFLEAKKVQKHNASSIVKELNVDYAIDGNGIIYQIERKDGKIEYKVSYTYKNKKRMWGLQYEFFYNLFNDTVEIFDFKLGKLRDYQDNDDHLNVDYVYHLYSVEVPQKNWKTFNINLSHQRPYNPVKMRVEEVQWDGVPRAERYFIDLVGCEDSQYTREVTRVWLTGLIARIYEPGVKFEIVPILAGGQGIGKSTTCRRLFPDYFTDELKTFGDNKDDYQKLENVAIVELGEMKGVKKAEIADIKSFISTTHDVFRRPFERYVARVPRHCVFIGTSNPDDFLKDDTGERRFYPLKTGISTPQKHPMEVEESYFLQVLAEAKVWYDQGAPLTLSKEVIEISKEIQQDFKVDDPQRDSILDFLNMKVPPNWYEMDTVQRRNQYRAYHGLVLNYEDAHYRYYDLIECNHPITKTSINEIAQVVFGQDPIKHNASIGIHSKIRGVLNNLEGWRKDRVRLHKNSNPVQGYARVDPP